MDRLTGMEVFARVVEEGSFAAAAARLGLSRAMVSKHVLGLERRLGVRLLNRTTRRLSLTEAGTAYHDRVRQILADVEEAERRAAQLHQEPRGLLRLSAPMSFGIRHVAPLIPDYLERYGDVAVEVTFNDRFVDLVEEGYDVAIRIGALDDSSLVARRLASAPMTLCAADSYLQSRGTPLRPMDLSGHNCLLHTYATPRDEWRFTGPEGDRAVKVTGNFRANNGDALRAAALAGLGVVWEPEFNLADDIRAGRLRRLLAGWSAGDRGIFVVYPPNRFLSSKVRTFIDFLASRFGPAPPWEAGAA